MFGRRPNPILYNMYTTAQPEIVVAGSSRFVKMSVGFLLVTPGPVQVRDLYLNVQLFIPKGPSKWKFEITNPRWTGQQEFGVQASLVSGDNYRLAPGARVQPLALEVVLARPFGSDWSLKQSFGCEGLPHQEHERKLSVAQLDAIWEKHKIEERTGFIDHDFLDGFFPTEERK